MLVFLRDTLFEPRSTVRKKVLDLTAWTRHLSSPLVLDRIARDNPTFHGILIRGPSEEVTDGILTQLGRSWAAKGIRLQHIDLSGCLSITDRGVLGLLEAFSGLMRSIKLNGCPHITDRALASIRKHCPDLRCLEVSHCISCTSVGFGTLIPHCHRRITRLSVAHCPRVTDRFLALIRYEYIVRHHDPGTRQSRPLPSGQVSESLYTHEIRGEVLAYSTSGEVASCDHTTVS